MISLRLIRTGKKHQPSFRIVAQDVRRPPKGMYKEAIGIWSPLSRIRQVNKERALYWLSCGARPTNTVWNILVSEGVIKGVKRPVHKKAKKNSKRQASEAKTEEAPKTR